MALNFEPISKYSVYTDDHPSEASRAVQSTLAHSSDCLRKCRPNGIHGVIACPPRGAWKHHRSILMYAFLRRKLSLDIVDSLVEALIDQYLDSSILPDIRPIKMKNPDQLRISSPETFSHLSTLGFLIYDDARI